MVLKVKILSTIEDLWECWHMRVGGLVAAMLLLAACTTSVPASPTATAISVPASPAPLSTATNEPTPARLLSFQAAVYRDDAEGFEFDYPAGWTVGPTEQYSRGRITAFSSWSRPNDVLPDGTPPGETRFDVTVQLWDPIADLEAFVGQRRGAWDASGIQVLTQESLMLSEDHPAETFIVEGSDGAQGFFFFTVIGGKYLVLSGEGNLELLSEIAGTVRIFSAE